ncbi:MAG: hypothetical protein ACOX4L_03835 [Bacillota bacterium]|jgi:hypothetical protein
MNLKEFMEKPGSEVFKEAAKCRSKEELQAFFASRDVTVTDGEAEKLYALVSKSKVTELSDEELEEITGGRWSYEIVGCPKGHTEYVSLIRDVGYVDKDCYLCYYIAFRDRGTYSSAYCSKIDNDSEHWVW